MEKLSGKPAEMRPPIPEPNGDAKRSIDADRVDGISVGFKMSFASLIRKNIHDCFWVAANYLVIVIVVSILTAILFPIFLQSDGLFVLQLWLSIFCFYMVLSVCLSFMMPLFQSKQKRVVIVLTPYGVARSHKDRTIEIQWANYFWIVQWSGDVALATFATVAFIPREAFNSPEESQEFVQIARELHISRGAAWRDEWRGKTFGKGATNP